jgi:hypothetical protein
MSNYTESFITNVLRRKYSGNEWTFLSQVRNATGFSVREIRTADAMVFGNYPSRGLTIQGFEIKVSRQDWIKEKENPLKAEPIAQYCDQWWIVAPTGIVRLEELPAGWGLQEVEGEKIKVSRAAPILAPKDPPRSFWMSVMRSFAQEETNENEIKQAVALAEQNARRAGFESATKISEARIKSLEDQARSAKSSSEDSWNKYGALCSALGLNTQDIYTNAPLIKRIRYFLEHRRDLKSFSRNVLKEIEALHKILEEQEQAEAQTNEVQP